MSKTETQTKSKEKSKKSEFAIKKLAELEAIVKQADKAVQQVHEGPSTTTINSPFGELDVFPDFSNIDKTWQKKGYFGVRLMNTDEDGKVAGPSGVKIQIKKPDTGKSFVRVAMPESMAFVPMEAIDEMNETLEQKLLDINPDLKKRGFKIEKIIKKYSHNKNSRYWIIQTNITDEIVKDDRVKLGFSIRNGYNTGVSLGIDLFTFRLVCSNGAFAKGRDLQKMSFKHVGRDPKALLKTFETALMQAVEEWSEIISDYKKMAHVKLNEKIANYIYESTRKGWDIADRFFPSYYDINEDRREKKKPVIALTGKGKSVTLWENFNDMTYGLWRAQDPQDYEAKNKKGETVIKTRKAMAFNGLVTREKRLHDSVKYVLDNPKEFV